MHVSQVHISLPTLTDTDKKVISTCGGNVGASQRKLFDLERELSLKKSANCEEDLHFCLEELCYLFFI
ncbi:hypothetical protein AAC387_Pa08g1745 [Persea americana]